MEEDNNDIIEVKKVEEPKKEPVVKPHIEEKEEPKKAEVVQEESKKDKKGFSIAALVLGIISAVLFCLWYISIPCGILAIIFGILGIKSSKKGMSIAGLVTGAIGLVVSIIIFFTLVMIGMTFGIIDGYKGYNNHGIEFYDKYDYRDNLFD